MCPLLSTIWKLVRRESRVSSVKLVVKLRFKQLLGAAVKHRPHNLPLILNDGLHMLLGVLVVLFDDLGVISLEHPLF